MKLTTSLIVLLITIAGIWLIIESKRLKHKIFAIFLIALIIFTYVSFASVISDENLDLTTFNGIKTAGGLYLSWMGNAFTNIRTITANAIHMEWGKDESEEEQNT